MCNCFAEPWPVKNSQLVDTAVGLHGVKSLIIND